MMIKENMLFLKKGLWASQSLNLFLAGRRAALVLALTAFMFSAQVAVAGPHPNMYLNQAEIDAIKIKVDAKEEPWFSAHTKVISAANSALNRSPLSVTYQGSTSNQYFTEKPYCGWPSPPANGCRDGQINPNADRGDYVAAIQLGGAVRDLGLAYAFTGDVQYADKAIALIRVWSLDADTRMTPTTAAGNRIELFVTLPGYFYGADLIWNYDGWIASEKEAFRNWVKSVGAHARANGAGLNNFANWRVVLIASIGALLDDDELLNFAEAEWKRLLGIQVKNRGSIVEGQMGQEYGRTRGLHYSLYAINAMIQGAEILRHRGVNLYDYVFVDPEKGWRTDLEIALDTITPYAINPASWPYKQETTITQRDSMALFELAYTYYQKESYRDAIIRWKRPMDEIRIMGITTLTHATAFDIVTVPVPQVVLIIVTQPEAVTAIEGANASFSIVASGNDPLTYKWFRNNVLIAGATNASYTVVAASSSDNGSVYRSEVSNGEGTVVSDDAVLTVVTDGVAPTLMTTVAASATRVDILFSEAVSISSAETSANYQINM